MYSIIPALGQPKHIFFAVCSVREIVFITACIISHHLQDKLEIQHSHWQNSWLFEEWFETYLSWNEVMMWTISNHNQTQHTNYIIHIFPCEQPVKRNQSHKNIHHHTKTSQPQTKKKTTMQNSQNQRHKTQQKRCRPNQSKCIDNTRTINRTQWSPPKTQATATKLSNHTTIFTNTTYHQQCQKCQETVNRLF